MGSHRRIYGKVEWTRRPVRVRWSEARNYRCRRRRPTNTAAAASALVRRRGEENAKWPSRSCSGLMRRGCQAPPPRPWRAGTTLNVESLLSRRQPRRAPVSFALRRAIQTWGSATAYARGSLANPAQQQAAAPSPALPPRPPQRPNNSHRHRPRQNPRPGRRLSCPELRPGNREAEAQGKEAAATASAARAKEPVESRAWGRRTGPCCSCRTERGTGRLPGRKNGNRRRGRRHLRPSPPLANNSLWRCRDPGRRGAWRSGKRRRKPGESARALTGRSRSRSGNTSKRTACFCWVRTTPALPRLSAQVALAASKDDTWQRKKKIKKNQRVPELGVLLCDRMVFKSQLPALARLTLWTKHLYVMPCRVETAFSVFMQFFNRVILPALSPHFCVLFPGLQFLFSSKWPNAFISVQLEKWYYMMKL